MPSTIRLFHPAALLLCLFSAGLSAQQEGGQMSTQIYQLPKEQSVDLGNGQTLYPYRKNPPVGTVIEGSRTAPGIPTTGVQPLPRQPGAAAPPRSPSYRYYQPHKDNKGATIVGPDGVTYCRSPNGRLVVCY